MKAATIIKDGLQLGIIETYYSEQATRTISLSMNVNTTIQTCSLFFFKNVITQTLLLYVMGKTFNICLQKSECNA